MGWLARVIVTSGTAAVVGCASIAGIGEGSDGPNQSSNGAIVDARPDAAPASSSGTSGVSADASLDSAANPPPGASDAAPACLPLAADCNVNGDCCTGQCSSGRKCTTACAAPGKLCSQNGGCCAGSTCVFAWCT